MSERGWKVRRREEKETKVMTKRVKENGSHHAEGFRSFRETENKEIV